MKQTDTGRKHLLWWKITTKHACVFQYMAEFAELLLPVTDVRHQVVERVVQHLAQRNKDIPEVSDVSWTVHVVEGPTVNAFVLPVSKRRADTLHLLQFISQLKSYKQHFQVKLWFLYLFDIYPCVEWRGFRVHRNAGECGRCSPAHHHTGARDGSRSIRTFCKYKSLRWLEVTTGHAPSCQSLWYSKQTSGVELFNIQRQHPCRSLLGRPWNATHINTTAPSLMQSTWGGSFPQREWIQPLNLRRRLVF